MNDRIKELAKQAMIFSCENGGWRIITHVPDDFQEKFAELIVKECVSLFDGSKEMKTVGLLSHNQVIKQIKGHFGVE